MCNVTQKFKSNDISHERLCCYYKQGVIQPKLLVAHQLYD